MIIAGAIAGPILFQVNYGHDGGISVALCKYNTHTLVVAGKSFHGIAGAAAIFEIAFFVINLSILHDLLYFSHCYLAAIHSTAGVIAILQKCCPPVKTAIAINR